MLQIAYTIQFPDEFEAYEFAMREYIPLDMYSNGPVVLVGQTVAFAFKLDLKRHELENSVPHSAIMERVTDGATLVSLSIYDTNA